MRGNKKIINKIMMMILTGVILAGTTGELKTFAGVSKGLESLGNNFGGEDREKKPKAPKQDKEEKKKRKNVSTAKKLNDIREAVEKICGKIEAGEEVSVEEIEAVNNMIKYPGVNSIIQQVNSRVKGTERKEDIVKKNKDIVKYNKESRGDVRICLIIKYEDGREINGEIEEINEGIIYINTKIQKIGSVRWRR